MAVFLEPEVVAVGLGGLRGPRFRDTAGVANPCPFRLKVSWTASAFAEARWTDGDCATSRSSISATSVGSVAVRTDERYTNSPRTRSGGRLFAWERSGAGRGECGARMMSFG